VFEFFDEEHGGGLVVIGLWVREVERVGLEVRGGEEMALSKAVAPV
jgi:hypothetical protein